MHRWDQRFAINPSKDNLHNHEFYRQYFDKPSGRKLLTVLPRTRTSNVSLRTTFGYNSQRIPAWSKAVPRKCKKRERNWNDRFNVLYSKDNQFFHKSTREYFDRRKVIGESQSARELLPMVPRTPGTQGSLRATHRSVEAPTAWGGSDIRTVSQ